MPLQNFVARSLPTISAAWLNQVDALKFSVFADAATKAAARAALTSDASFTVSPFATGGAQLTQATYNGYLDASEQYKRTAAEISAGVFPIRYEFFPGDVRRYCTAAETNHQQAFTDAYAANSVVYVPAGTWNVDHFLMDVDGKTLKTDGFATIIKQRAGNTNRRIIEVCASNIVIQDLKLEGQIATDTGEQQHGLLVSGNHPTEADRDLTNIQIGNIWGENIRGDVLYLGAPAGSTTTGISFGVIRGTNTYRNVVSIVGASYIYGVGIYTDGGCGYETFDIEPDGASESTDIYIGFIRGGNIQCAPPSSVARRIYIGSCDLNPAYQPNCTPGYSEGGSSYAVQIRTAINLRNTVGFNIDYVKIRDHTYFGANYIFNGGEQRGQDIRFGYLDSDGVGGSESTQNTLLNFAAVESFTLDGGNVVLDDPTVDSVMMGDPSSTPSLSRFIVNNLTLNGRLVRYCNNGRFSQIFSDHTNDITLLFNTDNCVLEASSITQPKFISFTTGLTVISSSVTCSSTYIGSTCSNLSFINCSGGLASILAGSATYDPPSLADGAGVTTAITVTAAALGDMVTGYSSSLDLQNIGLTAYVDAAGSVKFRFQNESTFTVDLNSLTLRAQVKRV